MEQLVASGARVDKAFDAAAKYRVEHPKNRTENAVDGRRCQIQVHEPVAPGPRLRDQQEELFRRRHRRVRGGVQDEPT